MITNIYIKLLITILFFNVSLSLFAQKSEFSNIKDTIPKLKYQNYKSNLFTYHSKNILLLKKEPQNNINLFIPKSNYYSLFNKDTHKYEFYSSSFPNNFDMKQSQIYQNKYNNIDSFNPYGSQDILGSLILGSINYLLRSKK